MTYSSSSISPDRSQWKRALTALVLLAANNATPGHSFRTAAAFTSEQRTTTQRFFRSPADGVASIFGNDLRPTTATTNDNDSLGPDAAISKMPIWLSVPQSHLVQHNMGRLQQAMTKSFFTENEASKLMDAIADAANGDSDKLAGAADFCLILVETMEMGLPALIAAAFHYCHCVSARERSLLPRHDSVSQFAPWESHQHHKVDYYGEHAAQIERDAARLKRLEVVASIVIQNNGNSQRVTPDSKDAENLRKLLLTESKDWRALAIRSAACLYRLRGIMKSGEANRLTPEIVRASREALYIYAPLASRLGMHRLKNELEGAAFQILYRRQFARVTSLLHTTRNGKPLYRGEKQIGICQSMQHILDETRYEMTERLRKDPVFSHSVLDFTVTARVKEPYSTWRKMLRNGLDHILQVPDAIAFRIVLNAKKDDPNEHSSITRARERALCYYAQKICTDRWAPLQDNPRFKDYIECPKHNGYQSLHYTASTEWNGVDWMMEIQVRSEEMHKVAEFGLASHWDYKARSQSMTTSADTQEQISSYRSFRGNSNDSSDGYLRKLQEWHWRQMGGATQQFQEQPDPTYSFSEQAESELRADRIRARTERLAPYIEALTSAQSDLVREQVFVFLHNGEAAATTEGHVMALPSGAVVLDALRELERGGGIAPSYFFSEDTISHNGSPAVMTSRLQNGDILTVPTVTPTPVAA